MASKVSEHAGRTGKGALAAEIQEFLSTHAAALDRESLDDIVAGYGEGASIRLVDERHPDIDFLAIEGLAAIRQFYARVLAEDTGKQLRHVLSNIVIEANDGARVVATSYTTTLRLVEAGPAFQAFGWARDELSATDGGWLLHKRELHLESAVPTFSEERYAIVSPSASA